jgi:hypothetical protein
MTVGTANRREHAELTIGHLCVGADWACSDGDIETLRYIAKRLVVVARDASLHGKLMRLAEMCRRDPDNAIAAWTLLKSELRAAQRW